MKKNALPFLTIFLSLLIGLFFNINKTYALTDLPYNPSDTLYTNATYVNVNDPGNEIGPRFQGCSSASSTIQGVYSVTLWLKKVGSPVDNLTLIATNGIRVSSGANWRLGSGNSIQGTAITTSFLPYTFDFPEPIGCKLNANSAYDLVLGLRRSGAYDGTNYYILATKNDAGTYTRSIGKFYNLSTTGGPSDFYGIPGYSVYTSFYYTLGNSYKTHIDSFTYSTTTKSVNITGYMTYTNSNLYDRLTYWQSSYLGQENYNFVNATTTGNFNYTYSVTTHNDISTSTPTTTPNIGFNYTLNANISSVNNLDYSITTVASSTIYITSSSSLSNIDDVLKYPEYECGISSMTGCFKNAMIWAFYPTSSAISNYNQFIDLMKTKAPMGYFFVIKDNLGGINASSTPVFNITIPTHIKTVFFNPFDLGISTILWFYYAVFFYKRLKHITV